MYGRRGVRRPLFSDLGYNDHVVGGSQCNHVNHVTTQLPYAVTCAVVSFVAYIIAGFVQNPFICLPIGIIMMVGTLAVIKKSMHNDGKSCEK